MLTTDQCERGGVYRVQARNFFVAAYNGDGGFIGIRTKFDARYLFTEYDTAQPIEKVGQLPESIELIELLDGAWCSQHDRLSEYREGQSPVPGGRGWWYHADDGSPLEKADTPLSKPYEPLFEALVPYELAENTRYETEETC